MNVRKKLLVSFAPFGEAGDLDVTMGIYTIFRHLNEVLQQ